MQNISFCGQIHNGISEITKAKRQGKLGISASREFFADKSGKIDTKTEIEKIKAEEMAKRHTLELQEKKKREIEEFAQMSNEEKIATCKRIIEKSPQSCDREILELAGIKFKKSIYDYGLPKAAEFYETLQGVSYNDIGLNIENIPCRCSHLLDKAVLDGSTLKKLPRTFPNVKTLYLTTSKADAIDLSNAEMIGKVVTHSVDVPEQVKFLNNRHVEYAQTPEVVAIKDYLEKAKENGDKIDYSQIMLLAGINVFKNGSGLSISEYHQPNGSTFKDLGINENELVKNVTRVYGTMDLRNSSLTTLGQIKEVGNGFVVDSNTPELDDGGINVSFDV